MTMTDSPETDVVSNALNEYVAVHNRTFSIDRSQTVGASEIGQCERKIGALKFEHEPDMGIFRDAEYVDNWGARERGNLIEKHFIVPAIYRAYGDRARLLGDDQVSFTDNFLSCTPDCLIEEPDGQPPWLIEFKTHDPRKVINEPEAAHIYQAQVQMGMLHEVTGWRPEHAVISYTDASFLSDTKEFIVERNPAVYEAAKLRAQRIMTAESIHDLDPEGWIAGGKECKYCPFNTVCGRARHAVPEEADTVADRQFIAEITDKARIMQDYQAQEDLFRCKARGAQHEIKSRLREKGLRRIVGDGVSLSWYPVKGRISYDMPAINAALETYDRGIEEFKIEGDPSERLTVTTKEKAHTRAADYQMQRTKTLAENAKRYQKFPNDKDRSK